MYHEIEVESCIVRNMIVSFLDFIRRRKDSYENLVGRSGKRKRRRREVLALSKVGGQLTLG